MPLVINSCSQQPLSLWMIIGNIKSETYFEMMLHSLCMEDRLRNLKFIYWLLIVTNGCPQQPLSSQMTIGIKCFTYKLSGVILPTSHLSKILPNLIFTMLMWCIKIYLIHPGMCLSYLDPLFFIFFCISFRQKFCQIIGCHTSLGVGTLCWKSWICRYILYIF